MTNSAAPDRIIVKVQLPLSSNAAAAPALVYNADKTVLLQPPVDVQLLKKMNGANKQFFFATVSNGDLVLDRRAPWQEW